MKRKRHTRRTLRIFGLGLSGLIVIVGGLFFVQWRSALNPAALAHPIEAGTASSMSAAELSPDEVAPTSLTPDIPCKLPSTAAAITETPGAGTPRAKTIPKVDILFLLDATSSMAGAIDGVKNSIKAFVAEFQAHNMDAHVGLIAFRDRTIGEPSQMLLFNGQIFTTDTDCFSNAVSKLIANGGGDTPESALDALVLGARQPFRQEAGRKVLVLITDAPPKMPDRDTKSIDEAVRVIRDNRITFLYFIVNDADIYGQIKDQTKLGGGILPLNDAVSGKVEFERLLPEIARKVAKDS